MKTNSQLMREHADKVGIPLRTLAQVQETLASDKKKPGNVDVRMARMMLNHGRLTDEARAWVLANYPQEG